MTDKSFGGGKRRRRRECNQSPELKPQRCPQDAPLNSQFHIFLPSISQGQTAASSCPFSSPWLHPSFREQGVEHPPLAGLFSSSACEEELGITQGGRAGPGLLPQPCCRRAHKGVPSPAALAWIFNSSVHPGSSGFQSNSLHKMCNPGGEIPGLIHTERTQRREKWQCRQRGRKGEFL